MKPLLRNLLINISIIITLSIFYHIITMNLGYIGKSWWWIVLWSIMIPVVLVKITIDAFRLPTFRIRFVNGVITQSAMLIALFAIISSKEILKSLVLPLFWLFSIALGVSLIISVAPNLLKKYRDGKMK